MKMFLLLQDNGGKEYRHELTSKEVKKHQYAFEVPKPKGTKKLYDCPIKLGNYELRTNSAIFFINDTDIINEENATESKPLKRSDFQGLNITATRKKLGLTGSPIPGETKEMILDRYFGSRVEPKTTKVEPQVFNAQDAPQPNANNAMALLVNALNSGHINFETYLQQISLLQKNGILK